MIEPNRRYRRFIAAGLILATDFTPKAVGAEKAARSGDALQLALVAAGVRAARDNVTGRLRRGRLPEGRNP